MIERTTLCGMRAAMAVILGGMSASLCGIAGAQSAPDTPPADLILQNGQFYTPQGFRQAIAVRRGIIEVIGTSEAVNARRGTQTRVIDLQGATVLPGLHDMHVHPGGAGLGNLQCRFPQGLTPRQLTDTVAGCVKKKAKGEWVTGGQWDAASFGKTPPHRSILDRVSPDNPVALVDISGHSTWANSKALELAKITRETPNPQGGIVEKDAKGEPTGLLRESAAGLVRRIVPPPTFEQQVQALDWALNVMLSNGITSFTDAGVDESGLRAYATLADQGKLKQRVRVCIFWGRAFIDGRPSASEALIARRNFYARERLTPDCVKVVLDGVPTDGHTAAMLETYEHTDGKDEPERAKGLLMLPPDVVNPLVTRLDAQGLTVKFHAAGDAAVRAGLDAIEAARKANGFTGVLHDVGHNSFVNMEDIRRARALAATFEMSPYIWYPNPIIPDIRKAVGEERMKRWIPVKDAIDAGALVVPGSDWPVVPLVNPWIALETLVTRQAPGGGGEALGEAEKITLEQAIRLFTAESAKQMGERSRRGSIEEGLLADLVVIDRNPFQSPIAQLHDAKVKMTLVEGEVVYEAK
jgi:predicted amidohydrolase YtcJ